MTLRLEAEYAQFRQREAVSSELAQQRLTLAYGNAAEEDDEITTLKSLTEVATLNGSYGILRKI